MYETKRRMISIEGREFPVFKREFSDCNSVSAIAGSEKEGGSRTRAYLSLKDEGNTNWAIEANKDGLQVVMTGSSEVLTVAKALRFIAETLEDGINGKSM